METDRPALPKYLHQPEGRTLEFKENCNNMQGIIKSVIAFANTAGGVLVVGVRDQTREIIGVEDPLAQEERLTSVISDSIAPLILPDIDIQTVKNKELLVITVPHTAGPFFLKSKGEEEGVYVRFGSTNRKADGELLLSLRLVSRNRTFDESPQPGGRIDEPTVEKTFKDAGRSWTEQSIATLGIYTEHLGRKCATVGGTLLFDPDRLKFFPDSLIRCARFSGASKEHILDQRDIEAPLVQSIDEALLFIERNTRSAGRIGRMYRKDIPEYPKEALREALINAIVHADYSMKGCHIQVAIFDDRIEFLSPGGLPFGQTMEKALAGFSRLRNRVLGRAFRELRLIEQWGSGLQRILSLCRKRGLKAPDIAEFDQHFRVTLYSGAVSQRETYAWEEDLLPVLQEKEAISTQSAAEIWGVSNRTARTRLQKMVEGGTLYRVATSPRDPQAVYARVSDV
ncbi:MAG: ATP-binding protein [Chlamydiia bacterium]